MSSENKKDADSNMQILVHTIIPFMEGHVEFAKGQVTDEMDDLRLWNILADNIGDNAKIEDLQLMWYSKIKWAMEKFNHSEIAKRIAQIFYDVTEYKPIWLEKLKLNPIKQKIRVKDEYKRNREYRSPESESIKKPRIFVPSQALCNRAATPLSRETTPSPSRVPSLFRPSSVDSTSNAVVTTNRLVNPLTLGSPPFVGHVSADSTYRSNFNQNGAEYAASSSEFCDPNDMRACHDYNHRLHQLEKNYRDEFNRSKEMIMDRNITFENRIERRLELMKRELTNFSERMCEMIEEIKNDMKEHRRSIERIYGNRGPPFYEFPPI